MFGLFSQPNPARVAQRQLNKAKLHLLEVQEARENLIAQESALNERIARLAKLAAEVDRPSRDGSVKGDYPASEATAS